jgi:hypothetical protein
MQQQAVGIMDQHRYVLMMMVIEHVIIISLMMMVPMIMIVMMPIVINIPLLVMFEYHNCVPMINGIMLLIIAIINQDTKVSKGAQ